MVNWKETKCGKCRIQRRRPVCNSCFNYDKFIPIKITNADRIRSMSDEDLTKIIMCPYDTAGKPIEIMPCVNGNVQKFVPPEDCKKCMMEWLQSEVEV